MVKPMPFKKQEKLAGQPAGDSYGQERRFPCGHMSKVQGAGLAYAMADV